MAVIVRHDRPGPAPQEPAGEHRRVPCEVEAPDQGDVDREAPECRPGRSTEAPDAGEGRMNLLEHEFTHGRSQS